MQESSSVRVTSTANRMGRAWVARLFVLLVTLDVFLCAFALGGYALYREREALGAEWTLSLERGIEIPATEEGVAPEAILYRFRLPGGQWSEIDVLPYLYALKPFAIALGAIEFLQICGQGAWGARKARKLLRPLDRMAAAARELSKIQAMPQPPSVSEGDGGERLHGLEEAIGRISPNNPGERLETGDIEMQGLERAINAMLARMHDSYRQQAQFVSDASHELRTPIAVIQGYAAMLSRWGKSDPKVLEEGIEAIKSESDYMKKLIEQLLFLARGDTGRNRMEKTRVSLTALMRECCEDARLIDSEHEWSFEAAEDVLAFADADMIKQLARILIENARKYTPAGGSVRLRAMYNAANEACMVVQDTGNGISEKDVKHIFDRFYRADAARSREQGGTGLGLSIAKWIVDSHNGHFDVLSREGLGTRFLVYLPAWNGQDAEKPVE